MQKKYYIAADGGGSKLHAILYDEGFNIIRTSKFSGTNDNFIPKEVVRKNLIDTVNAMLGNDDITVDRVDLCLVGGEKIMEEILKSEKRVLSYHFHGEGPSSLAAALETEATMALCGTGSDVFNVKDGRSLSAVGGWGALLGDEGSGYDIGLRALKAAQYSFDGRGEKSMLEGMVMENWKLSRLSDIIGVMVKTADTRHEVASAAMLCSKAANAGDEVAIQIYNYAADEMFKMYKALYKRYPEQFNGKVVITGGAWKGYHGMLDRFSELVKTVTPDAVILKPIYEPVVGCVVRRLIEEGYKVENIKEMISKGFEPLLYK